MLLRALSILAILWTLPAGAEPVEVDIELFLAVDVSRSMSPDELEIQRRGYAAALTSDEVLGAIGDGMLGRIAITYVEWAGATSQHVVVPWTLIESRAQAEAIAASLTADFSASMRRTSISGAIDFGRASIASNDFKGLRRVIDVSGDGPNNDGVPVTEARERALADGIVINGLPLMTNTGLGYRFEHLDLYYRDCVIGGPGAFMIPVTDWEQFAPAVRRKIVLELAGKPPVPRPAPRLVPVQATAPTDCLVGEKMRRQRDRFFNNP